MTVPNSTYDIRYRGSGKTDEVFFIPFNFQTTAVVKVETIASDGTATQKTVTVDFDITPENSNGDTGDGGLPADYGWIKWKGTSPTDIVHIYREETPTQPNDWTSSLDTTEFESSLDKIMNSASRTINRRTAIPEKFNGKGRRINNAGDPVRHDDAMTSNILSDMDITPSLTIPTPPAFNDYLLAPRAYIPSTPDVNWEVRYPQPTLPIITRKILRSTGGGGNFDWSLQNWIPPAPNDGLGHFLHVDEDGDFSWQRVYEVPIDLAGSDDDVVQLDRGEIINWRTLREAPVITNAAAVDRFVMLANNGTIKWSPRFSHGSVTVKTTSAAGTKPLDHASRQYTFSVSHGLVDDAGSDLEPTRVLLMLETEDLVASTPIFHWRLNSMDESPLNIGVDSTSLRGTFGLVNVNDDLNVDATKPGALAFTDIDVTIHFLVWSTT